MKLTIFNTILINISRIWYKKYAVYVIMKMLSKFYDKINYEQKERKIH